MKLEQIIKKELRNLTEGSHGDNQNYMFFSNIEQMHRQCKLLMQEDHDKIDSILSEHDWAQDHIAEAKSLLDQVFDFLMNETKDSGSESEETDIKADPSFFSLNETMDIDESKNKPTNAKLWARAKSMAKSKFKVYPSAYANGWASKWYKKHGGGWRKSKK
jgi:hypothetical protein